MQGAAIKPFYHIAESLSNTETNAASTLSASFHVRQTGAYYSVAPHLMRALHLLKLPKSPSRKIMYF